MNIYNTRITLLIVVVLVHGSRLPGLHTGIPRSIEKKKRNYVPIKNKEAMPLPSAGQPA